MRFNNQELDEDGYEADRRMHQEKDDALTEETMSKSVRKRLAVQSPEEKTMDDRNNEEEIRQAFEKWCKSNFIDEEIQFSLNYGSNKFMARGYYSGYKAGLSANETKIAITVEALEDLTELLVASGIGAYGNGYNISMKDFCNEALQKINEGKRK